MKKLFPWRAEFLAVALSLATAYSAYAVPPSAVYVQLPVRGWDIIIGDNRGGAYPLSWQNIRTGWSAFIEVSVDGVPLPRDKYRINGGRGEITFTKRLAKGAVAHIAYEYEPKPGERSRSNPSAVSPLAVPLKRFGSQGVFELVALPQDGDSAMRLLWRQRGQMQLFGGRLTSQLMFRPQDGWGDEDAGLLLGYAVGTDKTTFNMRADYSRIGEDFAQDAGKRLGYADPSERLAINGRARLTAGLALSTNLVETKQLVTDNRSRQIQIALNMKEKQNRLAVDASRQSTESIPSGNRPSSETINENVTVTLRPDKRVDVSVSEVSETRQTENAAELVSRNQIARAEIVPDKNTRVAGTLSWTRPVRGEAVRTGEVSARLRRGFFDASGVYQSRSDMADTARGLLAIEPWKGMKVSGGVTRNPVEGGRPLDAMRQEYGLNTRIGFLELGGAYTLTDWESQDQDDYGNWKMDVALRLGRQTRLIGNYSSRFVYGSMLPIGVQAYGLGLTHNLGDWFNFSVSGSATRDANLNGQPADVRGEAKLGVRF